MLILNVKTWVILRVILNVASQQKHGGSNECMSCIIHLVVLHAILRRSQMLLTFSRYQITYNVSCVAPC